MPYLRLAVRGLTVSLDFLEITVVHSDKVVLPVIDVVAVVVDGVALELVEIVGVVKK